MAERNHILDLWVQSNYTRAIRLPKEHEICYRIGDVSYGPIERTAIHSFCMSIHRQLSMTRMNALSAGDHDCYLEDTIQ